MLYANCTPNLLFQKISLCFYKTDINLGRINYEIRSKVKGKLVTVEKSKVKQVIKKYVKIYT